jgi:hypothetical protein
MEKMVFKSRRTAQMEANKLKRCAELSHEKARFTVELVPEGGYAIRAKIGTIPFMDGEPGFDGLLSKIDIFGKTEV